MSKNEQYKYLFKQSKMVVKDWEVQFFSKHQRKPSKEEVSAAPEKVLLAYKNCKKIKLYFESNRERRSKEKENARENDETGSDSVDRTSFSGIFPSNEACADISNVKNKVWGQHLNQKVSNPETTAPRIQVSASKEPATRPSLKRKSRIMNKSQSFFGSLGDDSNMLEDLSQSSLLETVDVGDMMEKSLSAPDAFLCEVPLAKSSCSAHVKTIQNPRLEHTVDSSWLDRCVRLDTTDSQVDLKHGVEEEKNFSKEIQDDFVVATPEKSVSRPKISRRATPTTFAGLFSERPDDQGSKKIVENLNADVDTNSEGGRHTSRSRKSKRSRPASSEDEDEQKNMKEDSQTVSPDIKHVGKRIKADNVSDPSPEIDAPCDSTGTEKGPNKVNLFALGFEENDVQSEGITSKHEAKGKERIKNRMTTVGVNENYRKINLKKKSYSKGKKSGEILKKIEYKRKVALKEGKSIQTLKCFRCGEPGHISTQCTGGKGDRLIPQELASEFANEEFQTVEETTRKTLNKYNCEDSGNSKAVQSLNIDLDEDDDILLKTMKEHQFLDKGLELNLSTEPFAKSNIIDNSLIRNTLNKFGHKDFRPGQEEAITRILRGESTLVLLATGSGKSLIYQLPAYLYAEKRQSITIVVSPLVSLMEDQVTGLPSFLRAAALHYNQTAKAKEKVIEQIKSGQLHFLLVSPEAVAGGGGVFGSLIPNLPPIAFACIDESHCVSQWSHNFRPSYLRLCRVLREKLGVKTILGLTATAPERMIWNVADQLGVPEEGIIRGPLLPNNLTLTISKDDERDAALLELLSTDGALSDCDSVIVYCTRRDDCERVATYLRTKLQEREILLSERRKNKVRLSATAEPYHAGLPAGRRRTVQNHFMTGKLRVVVATVAFGMGIDKSDIRGIVHYNMPKTFESYIQEIGRAGRDGLPARCHLFLETEGKDLSELKRHVYSNSVDRYTLRKFLHMIFEARDEDEGNATEYKEIALSVAETVEALDLPEENIYTLLCYLESTSSKKDVCLPWVRLFNPVYSNCKVQCYGGPAQLTGIASNSPPLAAAIAFQRRQGITVNGSSSIDFPVVEVSGTMGWSSALVKKELKNLEWKQTASGWKRTGVVVEFTNLAFHFDAIRHPSEEMLDRLQDELFGRSRTQEFSELSNLLRLHRAFSLVAFRSHLNATGSQVCERSDRLKQYISSYFSEPEKILDEVKVVPDHYDNETDIRDRIRSFVYENGDNNWNGRAIARVFHGIQSPNYPAKQWGRTKHWRYYLDIDFNYLVKVASEEILRIRTGQ